MKLKAYAKINLCLDILGEDSSGYHKVQTVFHEIKSLYDEIEIIPTKEKDEVCPFRPPRVKAVLYPQKSDDMIFKTLTFIKKTFKIKKFVKIKIKKNIPFASGLGGGSSNAAAILRGLNKLWKLKLSKARLAALGAKLGMDVPFFIYGGTALGLHYGEKITPLQEIKNIKLKIFAKKTPPATRKTQENYAKLDLKKCGKNLGKTKKLISAIKTKNAKSIIENLHNDFETITKVPKQKHLSGAGPSTFTAKPTS